MLRGQIRGIRQHLTKKMRDLRDLQKRIVRSHEPGWRGKPYTVTNIQKNLDTIISGQYIQDFLWGQVTRKRRRLGMAFGTDEEDRKSTRLNSSHEWISYAVFCLKKKKKKSSDMMICYTTREL